MQRQRIYFIALVLCILASIAEGQTPQAAVEAYNRAAACYKKGDIDGAIAELTRAIEISSRPGIPRSGVPGTFNLDQIKVLDPLTAAAYSNRGLMRFLKRDFDGAIEDSTLALEINPRLADAYNYRGISRCAKKDFDAALNDLNRALTIDSRNIDALNNRGLVVQTRRSKVCDAHGSAAPLTFRRLSRSIPDLIDAFANSINQLFLADNPHAGRNPFDVS